MLYNRNAKFSIFLLLHIVLPHIQTEANSSACEQKEKHDTVLDFARESISKAKDLHPTCDNDEKNVSSNSSACGAKEKVSAYLDVAMNLIKEAQDNYSACEVTNITKVVSLHKKPVDCYEILENGIKENGVYTIWPRHRILKGKPLKVYCDMKTDGGGWTIIQRRGTFSKKVDFFRNWSDYRNGFGVITEEFWLGNDNIFALTNQGDYFARFDMVKVDNKIHFAQYSSFWIEDEIGAYRLHFNNYTGTAGDGILASNNSKFSSKDRKNYVSKQDCISRKMSAWWFADCGYSNPNGINQPGGKDDWKFMNWGPLTNHDSLKSIEIKIKPLY